VEKNYEEAVRYYELAIANGSIIAINNLAYYYDKDLLKRCLDSFVKAVRAIPNILGNGKKILSEEETKTRNKLRINVKN
jgi:TPR repeat protein